MRSGKNHLSFFSQRPGTGVEVRGEGGGGENDDRDEISQVKGFGHLVEGLGVCVGISCLTFYWCCGVNLLSYLSSPF